MNSHSKPIAVVATVCAIALGLAGCGSTSNTSSPTTSDGSAAATSVMQTDTSSAATNPSAVQVSSHDAGLSQSSGGDSNKPLTIAVLTGPFTISTTLVEARDGMIAEAKKLGNVQVKVVVGDGAPAQLSAMQTLVAQGVDAILIDPADDKGIIPGVIAANRANIPVVGWVGGSAGGDMAGQVSFDENQGATEISKWAFQNIANSGDVALLQGTKSHPAGRAREKAFRAVLSQDPNVRLVAYSEAQWLQDKAYKDTQNFLTRDPGIKAIVAFTDEMGMGAITAVNERNLSHNVVVTGYNGNCAGLKSVWTGGLSASLYQPWGDAGRTAVDIAVGLRRGQQPKTNVVLPSLVIDKQRMNDVASGKADATEGETRSIKAAMNGCK